MASFLKKIFAQRAPKRLESECFVANTRDIALYCPRLHVRITMNYGIVPQGNVQMVALRQKNDRYKVYLKDDAGLHVIQKKPYNDVIPGSFENMTYAMACELLEEFDKTAHKLWTRYYTNVAIAKEDLPNHYSKSSYRPNKSMN